MKAVVPAILAKDAATLEQCLAKVQGLSDWVHIDIMDGKFVANTSVTLEDVSKSKLAKQFSIEAHLMVQHPEDYFLQCQEAGIKRVIFHVEAGDTEKIIGLAKERGFGFEIGAALNPETPIAALEPYMGKVSTVLVMSVHPGSQGQNFLPETLEKIKALRNLAPNMTIEVDGGINAETIGSAGEAGADVVMAGSSLFEGGEAKAHFEALQKIIST